MKANIWLAETPRDACELRAGRRHPTCQKAAADARETQMPLKSQREMFGRCLICLGALGIISTCSLRSLLWVKSCYPISFLLKGIKSSSRTMASRRPQRFCLFPHRHTGPVSDQQWSSSEVVKDFPKLKFQGKGHEFEDLKAILGAFVHVHFYTEVGLWWFMQVAIPSFDTETFSGSHGRIQEVAEGVVSIQGSFLNPLWFLSPHRRHRSVWSVIKEFHSIPWVAWVAANECD